MEIGKKFYATSRSKWRHWLFKNHKKESEIWLVLFRKSSKKESVSYNDAVLEALCFGWIDSIVKKIDQESFAQRFTPRRPTSVLSNLNTDRIKKLIEEGKMTQAGLDAVAHVFKPSI